MAEVFLITGSTGLIGSQSVEFFSAKGLEVVGIDNDMRSYFFGEDGSTRGNKSRLEQHIPSYHHKSIDIRQLEPLLMLFLFLPAPIKCTATRLTGCH